MAMAALYLVACVAGKRAHAAPARDLYTSTWFALARRHVEASGCPWRILSAEHGLVHPDTVIAPYERTLSTLPVAERRRWAERVLTDLLPLLARGDRVVFLAGQRYRESLIPVLTRHGITVEVPLQGKRIGEQMAWLKERDHAY
jgi:hypothetical protein